MLNPEQVNAIIGKTPKRKPLAPLASEVKQAEIPQRAETPAATDGEVIFELDPLADEELVMTGEDVISEEIDPDSKVASKAAHVESRSDIQTGYREITFPGIEAKAETKERSLNEDVVQWANELAASDSPIGRMLGGHKDLIDELTVRMQGKAKGLVLMKKFKNDRALLRAHVLEEGRHIAADIVEKNEDRLLK